MNTNFNHTHTSTITGFTKPVIMGACAMLVSMYTRPLFWNKQRKIVAP